MKEWKFAQGMGREFHGFNNILGSFKETPIISLAKEICQNSVDTKCSEDRPDEWDKKIIIKFDEYFIKKENIDGYNQLIDIYKKEYEFAKNNYEYDKSIEEFYGNAIKLLQQEEIKCLRISDYNTPGLTGEDKMFSSWSNLVKNIGVSDKPQGSGGSKGRGKLAAFACSNLYNVFYNTYSIENKRLSEGVVRLSSFTAENDEVVDGTGYYDNDYKPITDGLSILNGFERKEYGTDVIIIGFRDDIENWKQKLLSSIMDNFFVSLINGDLEVSINNDEFILNSNTIDDYIKREDIKCYLSIDTTKYYNILLTNDDSVIIRNYSMFEENDLELRLKKDEIDDGTINKVAAIRLTGMKILDLDRLPRIGIYHGILFFKGKKVNDYFRRLENETHDKWATYDNKEAEGKINELKSFIRNTIRNEFQVVTEDVIDAVGLSDILPDEDLEDGKDVEGINDDKITNISIKENKFNNSDKNISDDDDDDGTDKRQPGGGGILDPRTPEHPDDIPNPNPNPNVDEFEEVKKRLYVKKQKVIGLKDGYKMLLSTNSDLNKLKLDIYIYGEGSKEKTIITEAKVVKKGFIKTTLKSKIKENSLIIYGVKGQEEYEVEFKLNVDGIWSLEVNAYGD